MKVVFPKKAGGLPRQSMFERYYRVYYGYILSTLKHINASIRLGPESSVGDGQFVINIDGNPAVFDYSDHLKLAPQSEKYPHYFKFHYSQGVHEVNKNVYPFSPISFYDWNRYFSLKNEITYTCNSNRILNRQKPHGNATQRRRQVQATLKKYYSNEVATQPIDQVDFWKEVNNCLVSVCVPGSRNNMLDRGQLQYMAFGACTISPKIITLLPGFTPLVPGQHYIQCRDDYADLTEKIAWCKTHRKECIEIGNNAQTLFLATSTPQRLWEWVTQCKAQLISTNS